jgi:hypothetical protein
MKRRKIILIHLVVWLLISTIYFLISERLIAWLMLGFHDVMMWLWLLIIGLSIIFILVSFSLVFTLRRKKSMIKVPL